VTPVGAVRGLISTPICQTLGGGSQVPRNRPPLAHPGPARCAHCPRHPWLPWV